MQTHPFWAYLHAKKCRELTGPRTKPQGVVTSTDCSQTVLTEADAAKLVLKANDLFRQRDYVQFVKMLENANVNWPVSLVAKLKYARANISL